MVTSPQKIAESIITSLRAGRQVRQEIDDVGKLHFDRLLPFITVYRESKRKPDPAMRRLINTQSSYLIGQRSRAWATPFYQTLNAFLQVLHREFNTIMLLEVWTDEDLRTKETRDNPLTYQARLHFQDEFADEWISRAFYHDLSQIHINGVPIAVSYARRGQRQGPRGLPNLYHQPDDHDNSQQIIQVGLALSPAFRNADDNTLRPLVARKLRHEMSLALQRLFYRFTCRYTPMNPAHYFALGKRAFSQTARNIDQQLAHIANAFDLVMMATPTNAESAWKAFRHANFTTSPRFLYRPIIVNPDTLKKQLWNIPIHRVDDPSIENLFFQKREELDTQLSMLMERNSSSFLFNSMRLYGQVTDDLVQLARDLLDRVPFVRPHKSNKRLNAKAFANLARAELDRFREQLPDLPNKVEIRSSISGLITSHGNLYISRSYEIPEDRARALVQHEVGTHILTSINGSNQLFSLLQTGFDQYDSLQEGLAVIAEYFSGALDTSRLRMLAARVLAAKSVQDGADFLETFACVRGLNGLTQRSAFYITMRVHRSGGFIKDMIYLRGLKEILTYFEHGGDLELLLTGKIALKHVKLLEELRYRRILRAPVLSPSYINQTDFTAKFKQLSNGMTIPELVRS